MLRTKLLTVTAALLLCEASYAGTDINGFASIRAGMAIGDNDQLYDYSDNLDFKNESLAALQIKSDLGNGLSVTTQVLGRGSEDWEAKFEWAFLSYDLTEKVRLNVGRLRTPFYKYSDYLDVAYAYDWSRVPKSTYGSAFNNVEGAALLYYHTIGEYDSTLQFTVGTISNSVGSGSDSIDGQVNNVTAASWELSQNTHSLRFAYLQGKATLQADAFDGFTSLLTQLGLGNLADSIDVYDDSAWFLGLGFNYEKNNWVVVSEATKSEVEDSYTGKSLSYYLSLGYRFDKILPFVSLEKSEASAKPEIYADLDMSSPVYASVVSLISSQELDINSINVGVRYDLHPSAAFKAQYTSADNKIDGRNDSIVVFGVDLVF